LYRQDNIGLANPKTLRLRLINSETITEYSIHFLTRIKSAVYTTLISHCFYAIGKHSKIIQPFRFANLNRIQLGNRVTIHSNCWIQTLTDPEDDGGPKLIIGDNVAIGMNATISAAKKIVIDDGVFTARNVYISDHAHAFLDVTKPIGDQGITQVSEVRIGTGSWIGQNAAILPGVTIGKHCVIGANSVVNKDIPNYSVAVGLPAIVVKRFNLSKALWENVKSYE
jgi:acetyltransferase-like isoleucine patch superfamily enzyme